MARARRTGSGQSSSAEAVQLTLVGIALALVATALGAWWGGSSLAGLDTSGNPVNGLVEAVTGKRPWPWQSTAIAITVGLTLLAVFVLVAVKTMRGRTSVDGAAKTMVEPGKLRGVGRSESQRLVPQFEKKDPRSWGILLGYTVRGHRPVYLSWEMVMVALAGTRMGKTVAVAVRAALAAPGPTIITSNKPDLYALTRLGREKSGRVWVFDLQGVTGQPLMNFWWNPLKGLSKMAEARKLASFFVSASTAKGARVDSYFDGSAKELLALYCLAAGCAGGDLLHVATWLGRDQDDTPCQILTAHGKVRAAGRVREIQGLTERQRDGVFDMARRFLDVLSDDEYAAAVTPPSRAKIEVDATDKKSKPTVTVSHDVATHDLEEFDPAAFAASSDTLYALSMEGADSAAPLTTALVGQIFEAAMALASQTKAKEYPKRMPSWWPGWLPQPTVKTSGGRLEVPLVAVLDEAANTVLLKELPDQFSHFGGRAVIPIAILQSPQQGARVWGREELDSMIAGAVHFYGGNIKDEQYLSALSNQIGAHEVQATTRSAGRGGGGSSQSWQERPIMAVSDLAALPKSRAIVSFPANPPVLVEKVFWWETDDADTIRQSIARYAGSPELVHKLLHGTDDDDFDDGNGYVEAESIEEAKVRL
ncbi:type IV secretory system conjugative DNA transfer family protein [Rhodococcus koreensis]|uniref:type IV secretory system conjugative DNA transfer family protein n=1 Tax=Rhodococcus koreensis TaxID=99653 RepID=UPI00197E413C|nr:TraM recognition domain-containing protein [Rhodococcus koreensis]QSE87016.1 TraM recognition domain-containing protein [Rhodococcus koreensis]